MSCRHAQARNDVCLMVPMHIKHSSMRLLQQMCHFVFFEGKQSKGQGVELMCCCLVAGRRRGREASTQSLGVGDIQTGAQPAKPGQASGQQKPPRAPKREWETVAVLEDQEVKVKRVRQVMQAEADDAAEKALARELYRAFNDSSGYSSTDTNPLLRKSKLSDSNPLL